MTISFEQVLVVRKLRAGTVFRLLFIGLTVGFIPIGILLGVGGFLGADTVKWNDQPVHGIAALFAGPAVSLFAAVLFAGMFGTLTSLGLWLFSFVRPMTLRFVPADHAEQLEARY